MRVLALTKYGPRAASTRQRFLQYRPLLAQAGIELDISPLLDDRHVAALASGQRTSVAYVASQYLRRARALIAARRYDVVWIHCELFPYLPGFIEGAGTRLAGKRVMFDFDDAIFHMYDEHPKAPVRLLLAGKLAPLLRRASAATCGNEYLRDYAARYCPHSLVFPTVVDTQIYRPVSRKPRDPLTIGWIGSPSTWKNVRSILPAIERLCASGPARLRVVGSGRNAEQDRFDGMEIVDWSEATEVAEVQGFDIGIMPLLDEPFERGKSGYKLIQYMACGVPAIASPVGVNEQILDAGGGLSATTIEEWSAAFERLLADAQLRQSIAEQGRTAAVELYSLEAHAPRLVDLFRSVGGQG